MSVNNPVESKDSAMQTPLEGSKCTPVLVSSFRGKMRSNCRLQIMTPPTLPSSGSPPERLPPISLSFDNEKDEDGKDDMSTKLDDPQRKMYFEAAARLEELALASEQKKPLLSDEGNLSDGSCESSDAWRKFRSDDSDFAHLIHSNKFSTKNPKPLRHTSFLERGPDGSGVPMGPLINWSGQVTRTSMHS